MRLRAFHAIEHYRQNGCRRPANGRWKKSLPKTQRRPEAFGFGSTAIAAPPSLKGVCPFYSLRHALSDCKQQLYSCFYGRRHDDLQSCTLQVCQALQNSIRLLWTFCMSRPLRLQLSDGLYHVRLRGDIFVDDINREPGGQREVHAILQDLIPFP